MKKRGDLPGLSFFVSLIVAIFVILALLGAFYMYYRPNVDPNARANLNNFVGMYESCAGAEGEKCRCEDVFDMENLAKGHFFTLEKVGDNIKVSIKLKGKLIYDDILEVKDLCRISNIHELTSASVEEEFILRKGDSSMGYKFNDYDRVGFVKLEKDKTCVFLMREDDYFVEYVDLGGGRTPVHKKIENVDTLFFNEELDVCGAEEVGDEEESEKDEEELDI